MDLSKINERIDFLESIPYCGDKDADEDVDEALMQAYFDLAQKSSQVETY